MCCAEVRPYADGMVIRRSALVILVVGGPALLVAALLSINAGVHGPVVELNGRHFQTLYWVLALVSIGPWLVVREHSRWVRRSVAALGIIFSTFVVSRYVVANFALGTDSEHFLNSDVVQVGNALLTLAGGALVLACSLAALSAVRRHGARSIPGAAIMLLGAVLFMATPLSFPFGIVAQLCLAAGFFCLWSLEVSRQSGIRARREHDVVEFPTTAG